MGSIPIHQSKTLYDPSDPDAAALAANLKKWSSFYKRFRGPAGCTMPGRGGKARRLKADA